MPAVKSKLYLGGAVMIALLVVLVDFTSRALSIISDGALMLLFCYMLFLQRQADKSGT